MSVRIRLRVHLPPGDLVGAFGLSAAGHALLVTAVLVAGTRLGLPRPADPVMTVRLVAAPAATAPAPAPPREHRAKTVASRPAAEPPPKPAPPRVRRQADEPRVVESETSPPASARPESLPEAPEPAAEPPAAAEPAAGDDTSPGQEGPGPEGPIAGGVAGLETDQPFTADWYLQLVVARLQDAWRDRPLLPWGAATQRVVVGFTIERDGRVVDARVIRPSRYPPLDASALRAVRSLGRLPPLPRGYERDHLGARFVFELRPPTAR
ncbi:MAG: hypothetical protein Kow0062_15380 [Acidobacteriota bacterium]